MNVSVISADLFFSNLYIWDLKVIYIFWLSRKLFCVQLHYLFRFKIYVVYLLSVIYYLLYEVWWAVLLHYFKLSPLQIYLCAMLFFSNQLLPATCLAFFSHILVTYTMDNRAFNHVILASSSSWLQEHVSDISERLVWCRKLEGDEW